MASSQRRRHLHHDRIWPTYDHYARADFAGGYSPSPISPESLRARRQHLWLQADHWVLTSESSTVSASDDPMTIAQGLEVIGGQKPNTVTITDHGADFLFEYGELLSVHVDRDPAQTQWSIYWHGAGDASWLNGRDPSGTITVEAGLNVLLRALPR